VLALYQRDRAASIASFLPVDATENAPSGKRLPWDIYLGEPSHNFYNSEQIGGTLQLVHRFSDALTLNSATRFSNSSMKNGDVEPDVWHGVIDPLDADGLLPRYRYDFQADIDMLTSDNNLRFDFDTGAISHALLGGVDYLRTSLRSGGVYVVPKSEEDPNGVEPIDMYDPAYTGVPAGDFYKNPKDIASQVGFYLQDQIRYERATLLLGLRRDHAVTRVDGSETQTDDETTYRVGLMVDAGANLSPYISYAESFQPTIGLDFYGDPFKPQLGKQWETGIKWQPQPGTLVTLAVFDIRGTNRPETDPNNGENQIQQGEVKSRGVEFEAMHSVADDFMLSATFDYIDAEINRSIDPLAKGFPLAAVPMWQATAWAEKQFALDYDITLRTGFGVRYVGPTTEKGVFTDQIDEETSINVVGSQDTPGFTLADALLGFDWQQWTLDVNATNLFDKHYYASCSPRSACGTGYRRNIIGTLSYRF
jgi:iron complex outermembrane receptor protein